MKKNTTAKAIEELGGNKRVSKIFEVSEQAVSNWKVRGIPKSRIHVIKYINEKVYKELRSDNTNSETHQD